MPQPGPESHEELALFLATQNVEGVGEAGPARDPEQARKCWACPLRVFVCVSIFFTFVLVFICACWDKVSIPVATVIHTWSSITGVELWSTENRETKTLLLFFRNIYFCVFVLFEILYAFCACMCLSWAF